MSEIYKKKQFSCLEKDLFLNIIQKYEAIMSCKQMNASSALRKKQSWEKIREEFNKSSIVSQKASTKQLIKLWYNMKAKAKDSRTKENVCQLTGGEPCIVDMDPLDTKMMNIDKRILLLLGDHNNEEWSKLKENEAEKIETSSTYRTEKTINKVNLLKCQILEEELEFKKRLHEEEIKIKILEREHKEKLYKLEIDIKMNELEKIKKQQ